jgi:hypothetical protein
MMLLWLVSCGTGQADRFIVVEVDGVQIQRQTGMATIGAALAEAHVLLGPLDRVSPDLNDPTGRSTRIVVTRVHEDELKVEQVLPFARTMLRDEAMADGQSRLVQLGVNGREELDYKVTYENGAEVSRELLMRHTVERPRDEIVLLGARGLLRSVPIPGTIIYLSNGNAWLMRDNSSQKRPLTYTGDLDGRVFALSPDAERLLFTRRATVGGAAGAGGTLNELWQVEANFPPGPAWAVGLDDALYADWLSNSQIIVSTGERTVGAPGWKAHNDLWLFDGGAGTKRQLMEPLTNIAYAFWGLAYALSPDRKRLAYAGADQLGFIELPAGTRTLLQRLPPFETLAGWVWTPDVTWSPDARLMAATLHAPPPGTTQPQAAPAFDVWAISANGEFAAPLVPDSGMFANPVWSAQGRIAFAQARDPRHSADSQYDLWVMNGDSSNKQRIFPPPGDHGILNPQVAWSPDGMLLIALQDGNIFLVDPNTRNYVQLTADGGGSELRWR